MKKTFIFILLMLLSLVSGSACGTESEWGTGASERGVCSVADDSNLSDEAVGPVKIPQDVENESVKAEVYTETENSEEPFDEDPNFTVSSLLRTVYGNALPPLEVSTRTEPLAPGVPVPVTELKQAPQDLVGRDISLDLKTDPGEDVLVVYSPSSGKILLLLQRVDDTPQRNQESLLLVLATN